MSERMSDPVCACVNGVPIQSADERVAPDEMRQRACTELLRQAAQRAGLLSEDDPPAVDGVISEASARAVDALIERDVQVPEPTDDACRRYFAARESAFRVGERVQVRHILFAVIPGVDVTALRKRAESALIDVRSRNRSAGDGFADAARRDSNCPSGDEGGELGWLCEQDCAPEFAREVFGRPEIGVLPRLVHSRFGFHVVEVLAREPGMSPGFEPVRGAVRAALLQHAFVTALRQYVRLLAGPATIAGVSLDAADTPLVQ